MLRFLGLLLAVLVLSAVLVLRAAGTTWYVVESPSMGTAAPVGSLVVERPVQVERLRVGDVITYAPPTGSTTVTHRVASVSAAGVQTRGDANGAADPWLLSSKEVRGRAVALLPGVGWLVRLAPVLAGGAAVVLLLSSLLRDRAARAAVRLVGLSGVVSAAVVLMRPLVDAAITTVSVETGATEVGVAGTGMLPVRVSAPDGRSIDLVSGAHGMLLLPAGTAGRIELTTALHLEPWGWILFTALCGLPLLAAGSAAARHRVAVP